MEVSHRAGNVGEKENQITNAGFYICKHCNHTSSSLAATRDHLEGFHKDKVITDDDFISSVIYRQASSESESKTTASNDKKKSSTIRCKLCCESFVEGKEYMRHLKSCRATSSSQARSASPVETVQKGTGAKATRGRTSRGGARASATKLPELNSKRPATIKKRGRGAKANVGQRRPKTSTSSRPGDSSKSASSTGRGSPQNGNGGTRSGTSQYHPALDKANSPLPYCELCDKQFSMLTTYQIHTQSKEHKALEQARAEEEKTRNKTYSCSLCPDQGPWKHKRLYKQHCHTFQHKMAKKVEAMVSCIFTDQPFDENFSELQEERRQQLMQEERQKAASGGIPSGNSDTEDTMTTSSSAPSPGTLSGSRSNQHTTPNDTSAFNTQGTKDAVRRHQELEERVRKMLEPAKHLCLPPPPASRLRLDKKFSSSPFSAPESSVTIINDIPNHALPIDLDLSRSSSDQLTTFSGEPLQVVHSNTLSSSCSGSSSDQNSDLAVWEEAIDLMHRIASYSTFWNYRTVKQQQQNQQQQQQQHSTLASAIPVVAPGTISVLSPPSASTLVFSNSSQEAPTQHILANLV